MHEHRFSPGQIGPDKPVPGCSGNLKSFSFFADCDGLDERSMTTGSPVQPICPAQNFFPICREQIKLSA